MKDWKLDDYCAAEYANPSNRRFHAQPVACPACGPSYYLYPHLHSNNETAGGNEGSIRRVADMLRAGAILAVKGLGGYHLACDAQNPAAVAALRDRKYRKEKPFALMVRDVATARMVAEFSSEAEMLLTSVARPIVLAPARITLSGIAPENNELGVMLPYTPLHHLLFAAGAPEIMVMTSANRSSEPIAYEDEDGVAQDRVRGRDVQEIARSFQRGIAQGLSDALNVISRRHALDTIVLSGGVFQNELLLEDLKSLLTKILAQARR